MKLRCARVACHFIVLSFLALGLLGSLGVAQNFRGGIAGSVTDASGAQVRDLASGWYHPDRCQPYYSSEVLDAASASNPFPINGNWTANVTKTVVLQALASQPGFHLAVSG